MLQDRQLWRLIGGTAVIAVLGLLAFGGGAYLYVDHKLTSQTVNLKPVVGIPDDGQVLVNLPPYKGAHPRVLDRPDDPYPYPIPIGEVGPWEPLFAGPLQYPFYCRTVESGLGQPLPDNQEGFGVPVYREENGVATDEVIGYSKDCLVPTRVSYFYSRASDGKFYPYTTGGNHDVATLNLDGRVLPFVVRVETGTINRFPYLIAVLRGDNESPERPDAQHWNQRLIYQFRGGVGIGKVQGRISVPGLLGRRIDQLREGYAVAYSSANQTSNHYNILLAEETVARVKRQFIARYGTPVYTVGIGGSGGAIQQYLIAQNRPGLIDAAIALYAYPDMITQIPYVFDCELLEYYFDVTAAHEGRWRSWAERRLIEGTSASNEHSSEHGLLYDLAMLVRKRLPHFYSGSNECVNAWRGLTPLVNNPTYVFHAARYSESVRARTHWSYWDDMKYLLGTDSQGYARQTWDNVGVQYGLDALKQGKLSVPEFLRLNTHVGGWKRAEQMRPERYWKLGGVGGLLSFSPWGEHNMQLSPDQGRTPASRQQGDADAIEAAYRSGQVFLGYADIPIIDLRHYLDDQLDMHHSFASFSARVRLQKGQGSSDNQLIWMTRRPHEPLAEAFALLDRWLARRQQDEGLSAASSRPPEAADRCYDAEGVLIAEGGGVWDGAWNGRPDGLCTRRYPVFRESRMVAGAPFSGDVFKCRTQPVRQAVAEGVYGAVDMQPHLEKLEQVFPLGVCDYTQPGVGMVPHLMAEPGGAVLKIKKPER